ncbi:hypothetical protein Hanom_Chr11g00989331 [Helianthus anomalus]
MIGSGWGESKHFFISKTRMVPVVYGLPKFWIWSLAFLKYTDGPCSLHFVTHLVPNFTKSTWMVPMVCTL